MLSRDYSVFAPDTVEQIENHASVVFLPTPHIWQLNPHPPPAPTLLTKPSSFGRKSFSQAAPTSRDPTVTVITLNVQVKPECTDEEILRLTNWARERCLNALSSGSSSSPVDLKTSQRPGATRDASTTIRGQQHQVELTVQVMRFEEDRALQGEVGRQAHSHSHSHGHDHSHGHNAHSHSHGEQGEHTRHVIEQEPVHSHSHDAHSNSHGHHH